ncbi:MAG TPA: CpsD/CapB family tyrosine-protein kinase [Thermomicrobiaceae bacterium]|nr:CpsD/CapB family tyrosine-protein kinase [Thermomicrobiaceae bacterium]
MPVINRLHRRSAQGAELEIYRNLYTRILLRAGQKTEGIVLGITSATPGEGKTITALNLARAFAEDRRLASSSGQHRERLLGGKIGSQILDQGRLPHRGTPSDVLIIDCNEGRVRASHKLEVQELPGLTDYLTGSCSLNDIIRVTKTPQLAVIPVGASPDSLMVLIGSEGMRDLIEAVRWRFALVVVDLPAVLAGADTQAMTPLVDYLLMVVRSGQVSQKDLKRALELIEPQKLIGTVLNDRRRTLPNWLDQLF